MRVHTARADRRDPAYRSQGRPCRRDIACRGAQVLRARSGGRLHRQRLRNSVRRDPNWTCPSARQPNLADNRISLCSIGVLVSLGGFTSPQPPTLETPERQTRRGFLAVGTPPRKGSECGRGRRRAAHRARRPHAATARSDRSSSGSAPAAAATAAGEQAREQEATAVGAVHGLAALVTAHREGRLSPGVV